jgi:hypothetical protein
MIFFYWAILYAFPAALSVYLKQWHTRMKDRVVVVYIGVAVSIILMSLAGIRLTWNISLFSIVAVVLVFAVAAYLLKWTGVWYTVGAFGQELCILLAGSYLAGGYGLLVGAGATALVFALAHRAVGREWLWKPFLIFCWGCTSIALYQWLHDPLLNTALHALFGAMLIRTGLLFNYEP